MQKKYQNLAKQNLAKREDGLTSRKISVLLSQGDPVMGSFLHGARPFYGSDDQSMRFTCTLLTHGRQAKKSWHSESPKVLTQDDARSNLDVLKACLSAIS